MVQHHLKTELLLESQNGEDVVMAMGVVMNDALALESLNQRFHAQVPFGHLLRISRSAGDLGLVLLSLDVSLTHQ